VRPTQAIEILGNVSMPFGTFKPDASNPVDSNNGLLGLSWDSERRHSHSAADTEVTAYVYA